MKSVKYVIERAICGRWLPQIGYAFDTREQAHNEMAVVSERAKRLGSQDGFRVMEITQEKLTELRIQ